MMRRYEGVVGNSDVMSVANVDNAPAQPWATQVSHYPHHRTRSPHTLSHILWPFVNFYIYVSNSYVYFAIVTSQSQPSVQMCTCARAGEELYSVRLQNFVPSVFFYERLVGTLSKLKIVTVSNTRRLWGSSRK